MKKPVVFIIHFQNPVQIVHVYEVLRFGSFFQKFHGRFNLMSIFFTFHRFYEKTYEKTNQFYGLFPNVLSLCARSQNFVIWKFFLKKWLLFQYFNNLWFICSIWSNICDKVYEKTYHFFYIFRNFDSIFTSLKSFIISKSTKRKCRLLEYVNKILVIPGTLKYIFDQNCQKSSKFCNVFFNFVSFLTLSRSLVMTTFLQRKLQLFQCYNKILNVIKKSLLWGRFSQKSKSFKCWIERIAKYGLRFVKSEKNQICHTQIFQNTAYQSCNFFSGNLLWLRVITAIGKYIYWQNY